MSPATDDYPRYLEALVASITTWMTDAAQFPGSWTAAVHDLLSRASALTRA